MRRDGRAKTVTFLVFLLLLAAVPLVSAQSQRPAPASPNTDTEATLVGRIALVEGQLLRYVPEEKDWVATVKDAPFGMDDALYSDENGKGEFIMPNGTTIRIGANTQIQMMALKEDVTEVDVASGTARFYSKNSKTLIKATTPFGYAVGQPGSSFDLQVGDASLEVIALSGDVSFVHEGDNQKYDVMAGSSSVIADSRNVSFGNAENIPGWNDWNVQRDDLWAKRLQVRGDSVQYLPEEIQDEAPDLDENGRWERVNYEGEERELWRPTNVDDDWAPYTDGRWTDYNGDNCWVPDEPFGYVTHHYGDWVYAGNYWYWAPPVVSVGIGVPFVGIGFGWYPGRVGWIYSGVQIGWFPLAPFEPYYCFHHWGPRAMVIGNFGGVNINIGNYRYYNRAVIVNHNNFYNVRNYNSVRVTNVNRTAIATNFRGAPVVGNNVISNHSSMREKYNFTNAGVQRRPNDSVVSRIQQNKSVAANSRTANAASIRRDVARAGQGRSQPSAQIAAPKASSKPAGSNAMNGTATRSRSPQSAIDRGAGNAGATGSRAQGGTFRPERPSAAVLQREAGRSNAVSGERSQRDGSQRTGAAQRASRTPSGRGQTQAQAQSSRRTPVDSRQPGLTGGSSQRNSGSGRQAESQWQKRSTAQRSQDMSNGRAASRQYQQPRNSGQYRNQGQAGTGLRSAPQVRSQGVNQAHGSNQSGGKGTQESRGSH